MRLLHLVFGGSLESGYGRWRYVTSLVRALSDRGVESRVIAMDGKSSTRKALSMKEPTVLECPYPFDGHHEHLGVALRNLHLGAESLDRVRAEAERVDVVVLHDWEPALAANLLKNVSSVPVALTLHRAMVGADRENLDTWDAYAREMEEWICRRADRVIVPGGWMRSELVSQYGISEKDIHVVPGGVEPGGTPVDVNLPEFRTLFAKPGESLVLFAGRLVAGRGLLLLLEAAEETLRARPGIKFVLAGDGPERSRIQNEVTRRNLQDSVRLTGFLGTLVLSALYRASDVLVVPSTRENPGSSALESLAHGTPVVATTVGGLSEMADRCTGITLVSTASGADLAKGILSRLSKEPESTHVPDEFSWAEVARRSEAVYQSIMASVGS